jgi:hyperosmotically inducible periplasmic protein
MLVLLTIPPDGTWLAPLLFTKVEQENDMRKTTTHSLSAVAVALASTVAWGQQAETPDRSVQRAVQDAWIDGRLEGAYIFNDHLSAAAIDTDVKNGVVTLTGTVESDIDRDLAGEIAKGMQGVASVDNRLQTAGDTRGGARAIDTGAEADEQRSFGQWVNDATTSAAVKAALIRNENIRAGDIEVATEDDVVTLRGIVASEEQKELAERLAQNTRDVKQVRNELRVRS